VTGRLAERYLGVALDWQKPDDGVWPVDTDVLGSPVLRKLVAALGPTVLRVGGTDANGAWFCASGIGCEPPTSYADAFTDDDKAPQVFTSEDVEALVEFASAVDATILFTLNLGPGPRDPETGAWEGDNVREFLEFVADLDGGERFTTWEAGNEVNIIFNEYRMPQPLSPELYASDLATMRALINEVVPGTQLVGPASFFVPSTGAADLGFTEKTLAAVGDGVLDAVSWHLYATQSPRCGEAVSPFPASAETLFDPEQTAMNRGLAQSVAAAAGDLPVINSETASVQCGGQFGISDSMLDALWWTHWIGMMAEAGTSALVRQTLVGREYALVEQSSLVPHPSFLASVLHRRHAARAHLAVDAGAEDLYVHAYCARGRDDAVTVTVSNPLTRDRDVALAIDGHAATAAEQWTISAPLTATEATINGRAVESDGTTPDDPGEAVPVDEGVVNAHVPATSVVLIVADVGGQVDCA
jgi:hypothetical protein